MTEIKIGVIAEGPTDCLAIETLIGAYFRSKKIANSTLSFKSVQPYVDNTSRSGFSEGGWLLVYKWCLANNPEDRNSRYFTKGLFADDMDEFACSALLVHMDADICEEIGTRTTLEPVPSKHDAPHVRGEFITGTLKQWLWPGGAVEDLRHVVAPAVESIEAWLVAGLSETDLTPESDQQIQQRLAILDYQVVKQRPAPENIKSPDKSVSNFTKISAVAAANIDRITNRCPHFKAVAEQVVALAG